MNPPKGHTLVELLFCLLIIGILLGLAMPSFISTVERSRETEAVNQLLGALHYARSTAVFGRRLTTLCSGTEQCEPSNRWQRNLLAFTDVNRNGQIDEGETLIRQEYIPEGYTWYWSSFRRQNHIQFESDGTTLALNGTFTLCDKEFAVHQVIVNLSGRARHQRIEKRQCSD